MNFYLSGIQIPTVMQNHTKKNCTFSVKIYAHHSLVYYLAYSNIQQMHYK